MTNYIHIPLLNPVKFYEADPAELAKYFTRHFDVFPFRDRNQQPWNTGGEKYQQFFQTQDIIALQFEATFDPIVVRLLDLNGVAVITLPALIGLPHKTLPNTYSFEVEMSLATVPRGCYLLELVAGSGETARTFVSEPFSVYDEQVENSLVLEYWNSRYHADVMFESGIKFQYRLPGYIGRLTPSRKDEFYRDEPYNNVLLNSKTPRQFQVFFGDEFGIPDDVIDLLNRIWSCNNVLIDGKPFGIADGAQFELQEETNYRMRGCTLLVEEGLNRNSVVYGIDVDPNKKLVYGIMVDRKVFGDLANQGSGNTVPIFKVT
jgi:hypothetical protein